MLRFEPRFSALAPADVQAIVEARLRERREGVRLCARIAAGAVTAAFLATLLSRGSTQIGDSLPLFVVIAALACSLLGIVWVSSLVWRSRSFRIETRRETAPARPHLAEWNTGVHTIV